MRYFLYSLVLCLLPLSVQALEVEVRIEGLDREFVITSYSIHYTKLYENISVIYPASSKPEDVLAASNCSSIRNWMYLDMAVITSYSIH